MSLGDDKAVLAGCQDEVMDKRKIAQLGKVMAILGAGTLTVICIALIKSVGIFNLLQ